MKRRLEVIFALCVLILIVLPLIALIYPYLFAPKARVLTAEAEACLECHSDVKAEYDLSVLHSPFDKGECLDCHTSPCEPGNRSRLLAPQKELCLTCHQHQAQEMKTIFRHQPFEAGRCTDCHKPHASNYSGLLPRHINDFCVTCHPISSDLAKSDVHPPFKEHRCADCHSPHGSDYKGMLSDSQNVVCMLCHKEIAEDLQKSVTHLPVAQGKCTSCHNPHSTDTVSLLLSNQPSICYDCHSELETDFKRASHHPVGTRKLNCTGCHRAHGSSYSYLKIASGNNLCYVCHGDKEYRYEVTPHAVMEDIAGPGDCMNCHTVHGSDYGPLLVRDGISLCVSCHSFAGMKNQHPVGTTLVDANTKGALTCSSSCHNPHGTGRRAMLGSLPDGLCLECHSPSELP